MTAAADFWADLVSREAQRKAREQRTRAMRARPQYRVAQNDEPEPKTLVQINEECQAEARAILRQPLRAKDLNLAENDGGQQ